MLTRRAWLASAAGAAAAFLAGGPARALDRRTDILVYKSPTCGCCKLWVDHLVEAGFNPSVRDVPDVGPLKRDLGVPAPLASCHTALVGGYFLEGHVPADLAFKLLQEKPDAAGLAVPGMPMGSPGMQGPRREPYDVLLVMRDGSSRVYASR